MTSTITTLTGVLGVAVFFLAVAALVATATTENRALRRLARLRVVCAVSSALLVAGSVVGVVSGFALGAACLALLLSIHAMWLAIRSPAPLRSYLDRLTTDGDAAWRDGFERPFSEYVRRQRAAGSARAVRDGRD